MDSTKVKDKDTDRIHKNAHGDTPLSHHAQNVPRASASSAAPTSAARTPGARPVAVAAELPHKHLSIQQQFQLFANEDDDEDISLKVPPTPLSSSQPHLLVVTAPSHTSLRRTNCYSTQMSTANR